MFKFDIIDSNLHNSKKSKTPPVSQKKRGINPKSHDPHRTTFIIAEVKGKSIIGGACLKKKKLYEINGNVRDLISSCAFQDVYFWECLSIYLEMSSTFPPSGTHEAETLTQAFYRGLYREFAEFGTKMNVSFIIMKLAPDIYTSTKKWGLWPYVVDVKPSHSSDGLFHGILPLIGSQYESYKKTWETLDSYFKERVCLE